MHEQVFDSGVASILLREALDKHFTERAITKAVERHASEIAIAKWTPHDLSRTASTQLAKLGVIPHVKGTILNHALPHDGSL